MTQGLVSKVEEYSRKIDKMEIDFGLQSLAKAVRKLAVRNTT